MFFLSGLYWPFDKLLNDEEFRNYFLSHDAFVVRSDSLSEVGETEVLGTFYASSLNATLFVSSLCLDVSDLIFKWLGKAKFSWKMLTFM